MKRESGYTHFFSFPDNLLWMFFCGSDFSISLGMGWIEGVDGGEIRLSGFGPHLAGLVSWEEKEKGQRDTAQCHVVTEGSQGARGWTAIPKAGNNPSFLTESQRQQGPETSSFGTGVSQYYQTVNPWLKPPGMRCHRDTNTLLWKPIMVVLLCPCWRVFLEQGVGGGCSFSPAPRLGDLSLTS